MPEGRTVLLFDSDLLFFRRPEEVEKILRSHQPSSYVHLRETDPTYSQSPELRQLCGDVPYGFNSGLLIFQRDWLSRELIARVHGEIAALPKLNLLYQDQIYYVRLATLRGYSHFSPERYSEDGKRRPGDGVMVMKHYHSWMKTFFTLEGLLYLLRKD